MFHCLGYSTMKHFFKRLFRFSGIFDGTPFYHVFLMKMIVCGSTQQKLHAAFKQKNQFLYFFHSHSLYMSVSETCASSTQKFHFWFMFTKSFTCVKTKVDLNKIQKIQTRGFCFSRVLPKTPKFVCSNKIGLVSLAVSREGFGGTNVQILGFSSCIQFFLHMLIIRRSLGQLCLFLGTFHALQVFRFESQFTQKIFSGRTTFFFSHFCAYLHRRTKWSCLL